ncbi:Hcp family type VI secretion system effector [Burkholderia sp. WSM2232]|uniref:Hcp family type VI secretion system effector n=1 Tax=Burkholderia sp. WSM2232 TaxID=944436 RepID=UPI0004898C73|nr:Hcp family type VI secretion system effector [Burkholderia sp. WSM2232]
MPLPCYMTLTGQKQGNIEGSCTAAGHEKKILVHAVDMSIDRPNSPETGRPTGNRQHLGLTITKEIDESSPKLFQALCEGEQMTNVELQFYRVTTKGTEELYYTIKLTDATLVGGRTWVPNTLTPENRALTHMEDIRFTYEAITWTYVPKGIEADDSWAAPKKK